MNYLEFHRHIKNQEMLPVYLVTGEEHFLRNIVVSLLKSKIIKSDDALTFDFEQFSFPEIDFNLFKQTYYSPSIFSEKKMVVISAAQIGGSAKKSKGDQEILKKLLAIISKPNPSSCLMIVADKVDARTALYKRINKAGGLVFLKKVTLQQLPKYISSLAKKKKVSISKLAIDLLTDFVGSDLALIDQELEKISLFISPRTKLEIEDLEKHLIRWKEDSVFDIVEFIGTGRIGQAAAILNNLFMANPSDRSFSIKFLGLLSRHFRLLWMLIDLKGKISSSQMASRMKVQPFVVDKLSRQAGNFSPRIFPEIFALLLNTDKNLKSSGLGDEIIMADLLFKLGQL